MKNFYAPKLFFSSQGKTSQAHLGAKRNSPAAAGEYMVERALSHWRSTSDRTYNVLASSPQVLSVTVHRLILAQRWLPPQSLKSLRSWLSYPGTGAGLLSVKSGRFLHGQPYNVLHHVRPRLKHWVPLVFFLLSKVLFCFGAKATNSRLRHWWKDKIRL